MIKRYHVNRLPKTKGTGKEFRAKSRKPSGWERLWLLLIWTASYATSFCGAYVSDQVRFHIRAHRGTGIAMPKNTLAIGVELFATDYREVTLQAVESFRKQDVAG